MPGGAEEGCQEVGSGAGRLDNGCQVDIYMSLSGGNQVRTSGDN